MTASKSCRLAARQKPHTHALRSAFQPRRADGGGGCVNPSQTAGGGLVDAGWGRGAEDPADGAHFASHRSPPGGWRRRRRGVRVASGRNTAFGDVRTGEKRAKTEQEKELEKRQLVVDSDRLADSVRRSVGFWRRHGRVAVACE